MAHINAVGKILATVEHQKPLICVKIFILELVFTLNSMGKTKFNGSWQINRKWLLPLKSDLYKAQCIVCAAEINIPQGDGAIKSNEWTSKHIAMVKAQSTQRTFTSDNGTLYMSKGGDKVPLTPEEKKWNAEIFCAVNVVENNYLFNSCESDNQLYKQMFPDSDTVKSFRQADTKVKYVMQHGIKPHVLNLILTELKDQPFCFHFDETMSGQLKKQYDAYLTYWSAKSNEIITSYIGSLFVEHCAAADLLQYFQTFVSKLSLDVCLLMNLGMDGPTVNLSFQRQLISMLADDYETLIVNLGTCPLHKVNTAIGNVIAQIGKLFDADQFAIDVHFFSSNTLLVFT